MSALWFKINLLHRKLTFGYAYYIYYEVFPYIYMHTSPVKTLDITLMYGYGMKRLGFDSDIGVRS